MNNFYDKQGDLTTLKIEFYKNYIEGYLIKLLMGFGKCFIADLFCGAGKNGGKDGSPLALVSRIKYILTTPKLKNPQIYILFNDKEKKNVQNLEKELKNIKTDKHINIRPIQNKNFEDILPEILKQLKNKNLPKFFFLNPFTYSNVKMNNLKEIMSLSNAEILLFLPVFHGYRFSRDIKFKEDHKTRIFVEEFTTRGIYDYENIDDFVKSIKDKIKQELKLDFVRPILLVDGSRKNALFLLTKSQEGMMLMNKIALKKSEDGRGIDVKYARRKSLFGTVGTSKFELFAKKLANELQQKREMKNTEILKFMVMEEFLPKHAKDVLKNLKKEGKIKIFDNFNNEVIQSTKFFIAEKPLKFLFLNIFLKTIFSTACSRVRSSPKISYTHQKI